ncbi:hypothetical protein HPB51_002945 [Rhipicephalus microplus]|uniref:Serine hydrolase domain-containing protein n=1 Tax=Rhipicephalus microplus TaxID=6941 RepID=A0A9J6DSS9_RHIMP|nr:hypothetical protein HPB51_002945 [Rhipicephalus microplus]
MPMPNVSNDTVANQGNKYSFSVPSHSLDGSGPGEEVNATRQNCFHQVFRTRRTLGEINRSDRTYSTRRKTHWERRNMAEVIDRRNTKSQDAAAFKSKLGGFRKATKSLLDLVFIDAPHVIENGVYGEADNEGGRAWWFSSEKTFSSKEYTDTCRGFEESVKAIEQACKEQDGRRFEIYLVIQRLSMFDDCAALFVELPHIVGALLESFG